jgi:hypothetical protein
MPSADLFSVRFFDLFHRGECHVLSFGMKKPRSPSAKTIPDGNLGRRAF